MYRYASVTIICLLVAASVSAESMSPANDLIRQYQSKSTNQISSARGKQLWQQVFTASKTPVERSCASCHTADPRKSGKHIRTGKTIAALAPSVNHKRLTDTRKIQKWLKRNCLWTLGRECTATENGDLLSYLKEL